MVRRSVRRAPTTTDVARLAGVSQTTVSFVLNGKPNVRISEETRARVWKAVEQLAYRPNAVAQGLRRGRSQLIGFVTDQVATTPFAGLIIKGAQDAAWAHKRILLLVNTDNRQEMEEAAVETMLGYQVEGIIYSSWYHRAVNPPACLRETAAILVNCYAEDRSLPSVVPDEVQGGRLATEILLRKGHRRIGFLNKDLPIPAASGRLQGYRQALAAYGVPFDEELVVYMEGEEQERGYEGLRQLMALSNPPTAVFCFNDRTAMGVYAAARELGLRIPDDLAVMGFDNQEIIAAHLRPALSTVQLPHYQMGWWAVNYLLEAERRFASLPPVQQVLECPFIERESV
ncbi:LacI family DNA-binding transcriptional regulator [Geochorda subterranea]|uniref:LacI family DNA-binding transcriptional regulator n=1 Tax=Geochorda subterranea TaxID=3109564 RepID=A0ABZ1BPS7_9FIRM|nr:LacI family DNA-binding transcriptional regulator [Limnochorda sp. LNt]WRP14540.1 LacI family DNA-binding transcriptional regulator [Limnochorda sp. LNt]